MPLHELKTWPVFFCALADGRKRFEYRDASDRAFKVDDTLWLREWSATTRSYTGRSLFATVTFVLSALSPMVILSLDNVRDGHQPPDQQEASQAKPN